MTFFCAPLIFFQASKAKDCLTEVINLMRSISAHPSSDHSTSSSTDEAAALVFVACAHVVLAQIFRDSGDALNATKYLIAHLHMLLSPLGTHPPALPPSSQLPQALCPSSPTLYIYGIVTLYLLSPPNLCLLHSIFSSHFVRIALLRNDLTRAVTHHRQSV